MSVYTNVKTFNAAGVVHSFLMGLLAVASLCEHPPEGTPSALRKTSTHRVCLREDLYSEQNEQTNQLIYYHIKMTERGRALCRRKQ